MTYIMEGPGEAERLIAKTDRVLTRRHLDWTGLRHGESFLDVGCGAGDVVMEAARLTDPGLVVGVDANADRLDVARRRCAEAGLGAVRLEAAHVAGSGSSPFPAATFDHAWTRFFVEYLPDPAAAVCELARIVRPGGKVTLLDIEGNCTWHFGMPDELRAGVDEVLGDLATTGFDPNAGQRRHLDFRFIQTVWPLAHRAGLRDDDEVGTAKGERTHVLGIVAVVADRDADVPGLCPVHGRTRIARRVVALLVEAGIVGDVNHARASQQAAVGVDHRRAVERTIAVTLVEVEHDYDAKFTGFP